MISSVIVSAFNLLQSSVRSAAPVAAATPLRQAALVTAANALCAAIESERDGWSSILDESDPTGFAGAFPHHLRSIANACLDQASLDEIRGTVGRIAFNLTVVSGGFAPVSSSSVSAATSGAIGLMEIGIGRIGVAL